MKHWELTIKLSVTDSWIADGFNASERIEDIQDAIKGLLPFSYGHEVVCKAKITKAPLKSVIAALQNGTIEAKD